MLSASELTDNEALSNLPPVISHNLRVKLEAKQVSLSKFKLNKEKRRLVHNGIHVAEPPGPFYPLRIAWHPKTLFFDLKDDAVVRKLRVCNASSRSIYLKCGRFSNETGRVGASWCCLQRNRFLLAPGIMADIHIKATPRDFSPISSASITLQLAAAHMRDLAVAVHEVPILATFRNYVPLPLGEDG